MQLLVLIPADMTGLPHGIEDGHDLVAHPIISSLVGGSAKIEAIQQLVEARGEEDGRYPTPILILLIEVGDDLFPFPAFAGLGGLRERRVALIHGIGCSQDITIGMQVIHLEIFGILQDHKLPQAGGTLIALAIDEDIVSIESDGQTPDHDAAVFHSQSKAMVGLGSHTELKIVGGSRTEIGFQCLLDGKRIVVALGGRERRRKGRHRGGQSEWDIFDLFGYLGGSLLLRLDHGLEYLGEITAESDLI